MDEYVNRLIFSQGNAFENVEEFEEIKIWAKPYW